MFDYVYSRGGCGARAQEKQELLGKKKLKKMADSFIEIALSASDSEESNSQGDADHAELDKANAPCVHMDCCV